MKLILASQSPRRKELLARITSDFVALPADIDETVDLALTPQEYVLEMAQRKAQHIFKQNSESLVIGSDTIVAINGEVLGKPRDELDALRMLRQLSATTHHVYTGVYIMSKEQIEQQVVAAEVTFFELTETEIASYVATGDPLDKAGSYGIQGEAAFFVEQIKGDYHAIIGFPIAHVKRMLAAFNR